MRRAHNEAVLAGGGGIDLVAVFGAEVPHAQALALGGAEWPELVSDDGEPDGEVGAA